MNEKLIKLLVFIIVITISYIINIFIVKKEFQSLPKDEKLIFIYSNVFGTIGFFTYFLFSSLSKILKPLWDSLENLSKRINEFILDFIEEDK